MIFRGSLVFYLFYKGKFKVLGPFSANRRCNVRDELHHVINLVSFFWGGELAIVFLFLAIRRYNVRDELHHVITLVLFFWGGGRSFQSCSFFGNSSL